MSNCQHPADIDNTYDGSDIMEWGDDPATTDDRDYVDVNGNGIQEDEDGAFIRLAGVSCDENIFTGSVVSGGAYAFELSPGRNYTFSVCGVTSDRYPLFDLWMQRREPANDADERLLTMSGAPITDANGNTCVSFSYTNNDPNNIVFLHVNTQLHGTSCLADWHEWTLEIACDMCEIECAPDVYASATGGSCVANSVTAMTPSVSEFCDASDIQIVGGTLPGLTTPTTVLAETPETYDNGGAGFEAGAYTIMYEVTDCTGNTFSCVQNVIIEPVMVCNDNVNITLGASCNVEITADMITEAPCADDDNYIVTVVGVGSNIVTEPGNYTVRVEYAPLMGGVNTPTGIYCWGEILVEDKSGPICDVARQQYTAFCGSEVETETPEFSDCTGLASDTIIYDQAYGACGSYTNTTTGTTVSIANPEDVDTDGFIDAFMTAEVAIPQPTDIPTGFTLDNVVVRTWQMSDILGNGSASCRQYIYFWRPDNTSIMDPLPTVELECLSDLSAVALAAEDPQYVPHFPNPAYSGGGTIGEVFPFTRIDSNGEPEFLPLTTESHGSCKFTVSFNDIPLEDLCGQSEKMLREWTVLDWCSNELVINQFTQVVKTEDTVAPEWTTCPSSDPNDDGDTSDAEPGSTPENPLTLYSSSSSEGACYFVGLLAAPLATDQCGSVSYSAEIRNANEALLFIQQDLSTPVQIGFGLHQVVYLATDDCGNVAACPVYYNVIDDDQPVAICDEFTTVSLTNAVDGGARICADNLDSGSYDNCGITDRKVKRMDADEAVPFTDCIDLTCDDADNGLILVRLRVYDAAGNFNECMVQVEVQDKIGPFLTCPPDLTITCTDDLYDLELTGTVIEGTSRDIPQNGFAWDNCVLDSIRYTTNVSDLNCGAGEATRTWTAYSNGNAVSCTQNITISSINSFRVEFPADTTLTTCIDPDNLGDFGAPIITNDICAQVGVGHDDVRFDVVSGACYKILRTWTVINWCNYNENNLQNTALGNLVSERTYDDDGDGYFRYTQVIKVQDDVPPVFTSCPTGTVEFENTTADCGGTVDLMATATDACSNDINYEYFVDLDNDLSIDVTGTGNRFNDGRVYSYGEHRIVFIAEDGCGNTARCEYLFSIADAKAPSLACQSLSLPLMEGLNMVEIWASDYLEPSGVFDNCTPTDDLVVTIIRQSDSDQTTPPTTTGLTFDCDDLITDVNNDGILDTLASNTVTVEVWIGDDAGNWTFCTTDTEVFSNDSGCGPFGIIDDSRATVAGQITNEFGDNVENVTIEVNSDESVWDYTTEADGHYEIDGLPMYDSYTVAPESDMDPLNGVSTYDLVLMSQHILGVQPLDSPYKLIAADVNNDGAITTFDVVQLRQLILYITTDFQNNKSWRFVDANFVFPDPSNPFAATFPEMRTLNDLDHNAMTENFVAVKIGDVNGDAIANTLLGSEERNIAGTFTMTANDQLVAAGETVTVTLTSAQLAELAGFQFTLNFDADALEFVEVGASDLTGLSKANFGYSFVNEGTLTASWNGVADATKAVTQVVELTFTANQDVQLSEALSINSRYTKAEAYDADMNNMEIALQFNTANGTVIADAGFELFQNQPNPFSNTTDIGFTLPEAAEVMLTIYDVEGKQLRVINGAYDKGYHQLTIGNEDLTSGILYYRLDTPTHSATKKMIVIK